MKPKRVKPAQKVQEKREEKMEKKVEKAVVKRVDRRREPTTEELTYLYQAFANKSLTTNIAPAPINTPVYATQRYKVAQCRAFRNMSVLPGYFALFVQTPHSTQAFRVLTGPLLTNLSPVQYPPSNDQPTGSLPPFFADTSTAYFGGLGPTNLATDTTASSITASNAKIQPMAGLLQVEATTTLNGSCEMIVVGPDDYINNFGAKGTSFRLEPTGPNATSTNCNHVTYIYPGSYIGPGGANVVGMGSDFPAKVIGGNARATGYVPYYNAQGQWIQPTITGQPADAATNYFSGRTPDQVGGAIRAGCGWLMVKNTSTTDSLSLVVKCVATVAITLSQNNPMILEAPSTRNWVPDAMPMARGRIKINEGKHEYVGSDGVGFISCDTGTCVIQPVLRADYESIAQEVTGGTNGFIESVNETSYFDYVYRLVQQHGGTVYNVARKVLDSLSSRRGGAYDGSGLRRLQ